MKTWQLVVIATLGFLVTHLFALTLLPVFADESIYIRWAQLIMDEPARYAFFALNDGKTPLFIWLLTPLQYLFSDQLFAGRVLAVLGGVAQLWASVWLTKLLGGKRTAQLFTIGLVTLLPFWFLHHRLALMDGWLTALLTLSFAGVLWLGQHFETDATEGTWLAQVRQVVSSFFQKKSPAPRYTLQTIMIACIFGAALWTKLPAVLLLPALFLPAVLALFERKSYAARFLLYTTAIAVGGLAIFGLLRLTPTFGQLFSRGGDFLYPWREVLLNGRWTETILNFPTYGTYFTQYLSWAVVLAFVGVFLPGKKRQHLLLLLGALSFFLPIALLGKSVYPRYLLPVALFLTSSMALTFEQLLQLMKPRTYWSGTAPLSAQQRLAAITFTLGLIMTLYTTVGFLVPSYTNSDQIPFVSADRGQYLTEWSSGHGITQSVALIRERAQHTTLAVATEGFFGTLPDAILLYLHRNTPDSLWVEGIGQPVGGLSFSFLEHAQTADEVWLVVNSHRLIKQFPDSTLIAQYCRPYGAPCLQVWDVTEYAQSEQAYAEATGSDNR